MFMSEDGAESGDTFFHEQIARTTAKVLDAVRTTRASGSDSTTATATTLDVFSHEAAFLNPSVRLTPPTPVTTHFTVVSAPSVNGKALASSDEKSANERKPTLLPPHRSQLARSVTTTSNSSSSGTGSGASASTRLTPPATAAAAKLPVPLSSARKHAPELSEIRRKADAGRFKRHRSRISMIDIDEVKQIELEKVQKAEERKKQKAASAAKEKAALALAAAAAAAQSAEKASLNPTDEDDNGLETDATAAMMAAALSATRPTPQDDDDDDDHHDEEDDEEEEEDDNDATELHGLHLQQPPLRNDNEYVVADGTQALLTAAIMTEAASHQHSLQSQHVYHSHSYEPVAPPPQPLQHHYHRGFEPEDANQHQLYSSYGFAPTYASPFGDPGGYVSHQHVVPQVPPPFQLPHMQSQFGAGVFLDEPTPGPRHLPGFDPPPPPHPTSNQSHNHNHNHNNHNNGTGGATNSGFLSGPPEYWR